jgi:SAM-dependent methyltransferase
MTDDELRVLRQDFWDDRYGAHEQIWSGNPNPHLVERASRLAPGRALDVGSGEGADVLWLAEQGWTVTAVDVSPVALGKGAARAAAVGDAVAARISWERQDVLVWGPEPGAFDLVSAQFMHLPPEPRAALFARLAAGVAPGGTLLIVGHHPVDQAPEGYRHLHHMRFTAEEVADGLDPEGWEVVLADKAARTVERPDGVVTMHDARLEARRRA